MHDNCPTCQCDVWPCDWCGHWITHPRPAWQDWPSGYCSAGCYESEIHNRKRREKVHAVAAFDAKVQAGQPVCLAHKRAGGPCNAPPVIGSIYCNGHAPDDVRRARAKGIAWGQMAVDDDLCREKAGGDPNYTVIDAYRRREIVAGLIAGVLRR